MRRFQRHISVPVLLVFSLISAVLGQGFWANTVLCISGPDHVAFEQGRNGRCLPAPRQSRADHQTDELSSRTGCDPCSDISIFEDQACQQAPECNPGNPSLSCVQMQVSEACSRPAHSAWKTAPVLSSTLLSLRTQILLI